MQAIEKIDISTDWITFILALLFLCIFLLKGFNSTKLKAYFFAFFNKSFIVSEIEERTSLINRFSVVFTFFTVVNISLLLCYLLFFYQKTTILRFLLFTKVFFFVFIYFTLKWVLEQSFVILFSIQNELKFFLTSKNIYLQSFSLWLFPIAILLFFSNVNTGFLIALILILLCFRFLLILLNNKNLILKKLFYFILYLCTFEIAPLFILFKLVL